MERSLVAEISKTGWVPPGTLFRVFGSRSNTGICQVASMIYYAYGSEPISALSVVMWPTVISTLRKIFSKKLYRPGHGLQGRLPMGNRLN